MASSYTLTSSRFPDGTTVYANPVGEDDPPVSAVVSGGSAVFTGLREYADYVAHATIGTPDVDGAGVSYVQATFKTDGGSGGGGGEGSGWVEIDRLLVGSGGVGSYTLDNIPQDYFELRVETWLKTDMPSIFEYIRLRFNDDDEEDHYGFSSIYSNPGTGGGGGFNAGGGLYDGGNLPSLTAGLGAYAAGSGGEGGLLPVEAGWFPHSTIDIKRYTESIKHSYEIHQHYIDGMDQAWGAEPGSIYGNGPEFFYLASYWNQAEPITKIEITTTGNDDRETPVSGTLFLEGCLFVVSGTRPL